MKVRMYSKGFRRKNSRLDVNSYWHFTIDGKNDLIIRQPVSYDARLKKLVLTKKASEIQHEIHKEIEKHDKKVREGITEEELEVFNVMKK